MNERRALSLDALRGFAILTMALSAAVVFGILPGWMYHAQTPPPSNQFDPSVYGITWVDLVFPFFLFAMGAALPFSLGKKIKNRVPVWKLIGDSVLRGLKLAFFAIFMQHVTPHVISQPQDYRAWCTALLAFVVMFFLFLRLPWKASKLIRYAVELTGYGIAITMLLTIDYANGRTFDPGFSNIILLVLANMAIFASIAYIFTAKKPWARWLILPFILAVLIGGNTNPESWNAWLFNYSPVSWLYSFRFLKYLFIVIPGTVAGEYLMDWMQSYQPTDVSLVKKERQTAVCLLAVTIGLIIFNLYGLFTRQLVLNLFGSMGFVLLGYYFVGRITSSYTSLWKKLFTTGAYLLLLGLFLEAIEGGIRKDNATFSYYFVTSGLACMALIAFSILCDYFKYRKSTSFLVMSGQNPMIAYVASSLVIWPILKITHLFPLMDFFDTNPYLGFLRGIIITALVTLLTMFFTKIKWFWRS